MFKINVSRYSGGVKSSADLFKRYSSCINFERGGIITDFGNSPVFQDATAVNNGIIRSPLVHFRKHVRTNNCSPLFLRTPFIK